MPSFHNMSTNYIDLCDDGEAKEWIDFTRDGEEAAVGTKRKGKEKVEVVKKCKSKEASAEQMNIQVGWSELLHHAKIMDVMSTDLRAEDLCRLRGTIKSLRSLPLTIDIVRNTIESRKLKFSFLLRQLRVCCDDAPKYPREAIVLFAQAFCEKKGHARICSSWAASMICAEVEIAKEMTNEVRTMADVLAVLSDGGKHEITPHEATYRYPLGLEMYDVLDSACEGTFMKPTRNLCELCAIIGNRSLCMYCCEVLPASMFPTDEKDPECAFCVFENGEDEEDEEDRRFGRVRAAKLCLEKHREEHGTPGYFENYFYVRGENVFTPLHKYLGKIVQPFCAIQPFQGIQEMIIEKSDGTKMLFIRFFQVSYLGFDDHDMTEEAFEFYVAPLHETQQTSPEVRRMALYLRERRSKFAQDNAEREATDKCFADNSGIEVEVQD